MNAFVARHNTAALLMRTGLALHASGVALHALSARLDQWLADRARTEDDLQALANMSERELRDIGVSQASIRAVAQGDWARDALP